MTKNRYRLKDLPGRLGDRYQIFVKVHNLILSLNKGVEFRIFPIYVSYYLDDKNIALIYYGGRFVRDGGIDLGLNLRKDIIGKRFIRADYMHYPGITYSIKIKKLRDIDPTLVKIIKSVYRIELK